ncbi:MULTISPECIES: hypothetical protein [unclassified Saccharicrinis]|uniref:hypothetical protein n=1 Tax=unclassified Saccharicrinis TaxID=2646859 RepID=UPI003D32D728
MKYIVLIALAITLNISAQTDVKDQISMAQQTAQMQTAKLRLNIDLTDTQSIQTYGVLLKAATEFNEYIGKNKVGMEAKMIEIQNHSCQEFKSFLTQDQMTKLNAIMTASNNRLCL